jgi:hypothetical protein
MTTPQSGKDDHPEENGAPGENLKFILTKIGGWGKKFKH